MCHSRLLQFTEVNRVSFGSSLFYESPLRDYDKHDHLPGYLPELCFDRSPSCIQ